MSTQLFNKDNKQPTGLKINKCAVGRVSKNITVVLSACNEEMSIGSVILLTKLYADRVIVIDDASLDRTAEVAKKAGAEVIIQSTNKGKGVAFETGFKAAVNLGADIIVTMDSKGHHNPADIPRLVDPIITGSADMANGIRYLNGFGRNTPIYRCVSKTILGKFTSVSGKTTECQSGFHAFAASTTGAFHFDSQGVAIESKILPGTEKSDLRIKDIEIGSLRDFGAPGKQHILGILKTVVEDIEINQPLYLYAVPGFALATCGFYMGLKFLEAFLLGIGGLHFWSVFLMVFLSFFGVYMTVRGIVMHSLVEVTTQTEAM